MTKISEMTDAGTLDGTEEVPVLKGGANKKTKLRGYKVYTALLAQSGTDAPVATVLENTLGGVITYTYSATGAYNINVTNNAFTANKVACMVGDTFNSVGTAVNFLTPYTTSQIQMQVYDLDGNDTDDQLVQTLLEIRVYP